jgi:excisionase family DNA binding protein
LSQLEKASVEASDHKDSFLTVAEVAERLKLNQQTVRNWIDQGSLPALRVGRRVRIRRSDFDRLVGENYSGGAAAASRGAQGSPSADDFWGGAPVGLPDTRVRESGDEGVRVGGEDGSAEHLNRGRQPTQQELRGSERGSAEHPVTVIDAEGG